MVDKRPIGYIPGKGNVFYPSLTNPSLSIKNPQKAKSTRI
jgi:hypothetical protein